MDTPTPAELKRAQSRLAAIREDISTRLWPVNAGMSSHAFNELMDQMALLQFTFEQRVAHDHLVIDRRLGAPDRRELDAVLRSHRAIVGDAPDDPKAN
jgi:hypothetical protein